jgi:hypothetical protein
MSFVPNGDMTSSHNGTAIAEFTDLPSSGIPLSNRKARVLASRERLQMP